MDEHSCQLLEKLDKFFSSCPKVDWNSYFAAPYHVFPEDTKYNLEYYTTQKAKKTYATYMQALEIEDPDNPDSLLRVQQGFKFVYQFCKDKGLTFETYPLYVEDSLPCFVDHLKNHQISFYTLHGIGIAKINIEPGILDFIFGDFYKTFQSTKNKFYSSKKMKEFSKLAKTKLNNKLKIQ